MMIFFNVLGLILVTSGYIMSTNIKPGIKLEQFTYLKNMSDYLMLSGMIIVCSFYLLSNFPIFEMRSYQ